MAKSRERKAETEARLKAYKDSIEEETPLCCLVNPYGGYKNRKQCHKCTNYICEEHTCFVRGKFTCKRCLSIELLFEDLGASCLAKEIKSICSS